MAQVQPPRGDNTGPESIDFESTETMGIKSAFLEKTGQLQGFLEEHFEMNTEVTPQDYEYLVNEMKELLDEGFYRIDSRQSLAPGDTRKNQEREMLSPQEYNQGSTGILLAGLFALCKPSFVIATLRKSFDASVMESSMLSQVLDLGSGHRGLRLEKWENILGLVSTIQSNVSVVRRLREQRRAWRRGVRQSSHQNGSKKQISESSLDAMWVIPFSYVVGNVVFAFFRSHREAKAGSPPGSWDNDIQPFIENVLYSAFPHLRPRDCVDAGLLLLQVDVLSNYRSNVPHGISYTKLVQQLENQ